MYFLETEKCVIIDELYHCSDVKEESVGFLVWKQRPSEIPEYIQEMVRIFFRLLISGIFSLTTKLIWSASFVLDTVIALVTILDATAIKNKSFCLCLTVWQLDFGKSFAVYFRWKYHQSTWAFVWRCKPMLAKITQRQQVLPHPSSK